MTRSLDELQTLCRSWLVESDELTIGCVEDEVVVGDARIDESGTALSGFTRLMRERAIDTITFSRGVDAEELAVLVSELCADTGDPLEARLTHRRVRHVTVGRLATDLEPHVPVSVAASRRAYTDAVTTSRELWEEARTSGSPDPRAARGLVASLARLVSHDGAALMALTSLAREDDYTFNHMVNVSIMSMAMARSLDIRGPLLHEIGLAALMHDIGKVRMPAEIRDKPDRLTPEEFAIVKRHPVDGAHMLLDTPEMPALAPIVAFEHHLRQDLTGYPEHVAPRELNLATMIVTIVDVFDALRSNRVYRQAMPSERVRAIMVQHDSAAFHPVLLRRFVNLIGLYPTGTAVRLESGEVAIVVREHPADPFRPRVKVVLDGNGARLRDPIVIDTWSSDGAPCHQRQVAEAVDAASVGIDPREHV